MNYFCDSGGVIFHVDPERVFQGSANANVINFFGAFPSNAEVLLAYQLPNGTWTTPQRMTPIVQLSGVLDGNGNTYAGWQTRIGARLKMSNGAPVTDENGDYVYENDYTITENYGTVLVQFFVYANGGNGLGAQLATASSSFVVEKGVPIVLPITLTDQYETLLGQILAAISDKNEQIDTNAENIEQNAENISALDGSLATAKSDITVLQGAVSQLSSTVSGVQNTVSGLEIEVNKDLGHRIQMSLSNDYVLSLSLLAKDGTVLGETQTVDFPVESMVVNAFYDNATQSIVLTLKNGNYVDVPIGDLVDGLISSTEKGVANGVATLGADGKVPLSQLPDDIGGEELTQATFNDMLVEGLTANGNTLTDEEKTSACDWTGALKKETAVTNNHQAYVKGATGANTMWNMDNGPTPSAICVRDGNGRLRIADPANGGDCVNLTYFNANKGTKWYKHVMTQSIDMTGDSEPDMVFDWLIVSTRATAYTSAEDVYNSWVAGEIDMFFNSSFGSMKSKTLRIDSNYFAYGISDGGANIATSYQLSSGTLSYRETIQKL